MKNLIKALIECSEYLRLRKINSKLSFNEFMSSVLENKLNSKTIPSEYIFNEESNVYRLNFVDFFSSTSIIQSSYLLEKPTSMTQEDVFKVFSYVIQQINLSDYYIKNDVNVIESILKNRYGFKTYSCEFEEKTIVDLFLYPNNIKYFVKSHYFDRYFSWFIPNISREEIISIYENLSVDESQKLKILKRI